MPWHAGTTAVLGCALCMTGSAWPGLGLSKDDRLRLKVALESGFAEVAAETRGLETAEWERGVEGVVAVDPDGTWESREQKEYISEQGHASPCILHGAYYFKDRDSRSCLYSDKVHVPARILSATRLARTESWLNTEAPAD